MDAGRAASGDEQTGLNGPNSAQNPFDSAALLGRNDLIRLLTQLIQSFEVLVCTITARESRKQQDTLLLTVTSPNIDRFSKFFCHWTQQ